MNYEYENLFYTLFISSPYRCWCCHPTGSISSSHSSTTNLWPEAGRENSAAQALTQMQISYLHSM
ncbi:hypothetical protein I7I50_08691 [Histoplasma capsulatum G186AR]|uniref:Uncharacterized protein n=1 Tax=Ajellomyces capsulatus TaxID=5037 RepID=A0A8H7YNV7_AJECA|nr:hypothetical protein I7I52_06205 [Histoplasma capsulatum]QSS73792.1 hypothetical protein I7I50_08691 [Histoplasma capsulatum G186AR]